MKLKKYSIAACLLAALLLVSTLLGCSTRQFETASSDPGDSSSPNGSVMTPIELGSGLVLTGLSAASGTFPEDGSDTPISNVLCATFSNNGSAPLQYAAANVLLNGTDYSFQISTIPAGGTVHAFDLDMQEAPDSIDEVTATAEHIVFFPEELSVDAQRLKISFADGTIEVKNISGEAIDQEISIYYKTVVNGVYLGGITYRARVGALAAGQEVIGHSSHARGDSELMFVTYGS